MSAGSEARTVEGWSDASGFGSRTHRRRSVSLCDPPARQASRVGGSPVRRGGAQHRASATFDSRRRPLAQQLSSLFPRSDRRGDRSRAGRSRELGRQRGEGQRFREGLFTLKKSWNNYCDTDPHSSMIHGYCLAGTKVQVRLRSNAGGVRRRVSGMCGRRRGGLRAVPLERAA